MFSVIVPPDSEPPTRRAHKKSRHGCLTCKERKLKCDEVKPVCGNCERRFVDIQACDYGTPPSRRSEPPRTRALAPRISEPPSSGSEYRSESLSASASQSESEWEWKTSLPKSLCAELLDPFETHPECKVAGIDVLMKYYLKSAVYKVYPWQPPSDTNPTILYYVPLVWSDPVLFHATLQLSAVRLESHRSQRPHVNTSQLTAECIRLLRDRVENSELEKGVSDQTISAVATLAAIEHEKGNVRMLHMHIDGLKRMISIRGGLNAIRETNPMVANATFWMFVAAMYEVPFPALDPILPPFFPSDHNLVLSPRVISHFEDIGPTYQEPPPLDLPSLGLSEPIASILTSVQHISQLTTSTNAAYPSAATHLVILTRLMFLLSHLLSLPPITASFFPNPESSDAQISALVTESARYAILLHVFTPWRGLPPDGTLTINHLLHQMISSLKALLSHPDYTNNILLLWIFATGGVSALNMPERSWFMSHLADMTQEMGIGTWEEMKACVSRGIWHERLVGRAHRKLWDEIEVKKKVLVEA